MVKVPAPTGMVVPSSSAVQRGAQSQMGRPAVHSFSAARNVPSAFALMPMIMTEPQQSVMCWTSTQSATVSQVLSMVAMVESSPSHTISPLPPPLLAPPLLAPPLLVPALEFPPGLLPALGPPPICRPPLPWPPAGLPAVDVPRAAPALD